MGAAVQPGGLACGASLPGQEVGMFAQMREPRVRPQGPGVSEGKAAQASVGDSLLIPEGWAVRELG